MFCFIAVQKCFIPLDMRGGVKSCDICGSYVIVLLSEGNIGLLKLTSSNDIPKLDLSWAQLSTVIIIIIYICYYYYYY